MTVRPIAADTPMGANIVPGGTTFRVWAPTADAVHIALHGPGHPDPADWRPEEDNKLIRDQNGYWGGLVRGVGEGALYRFWTVGQAVGPAGAGYKRDPRARELELRGYPDCDGVVRGPAGYPWHDAGFRPPPFHELIVYQLHIGVFYASDGQRDIRANRVSKFLDVLGRLEYLADLGVNAIQPLPVVEWQGSNSRGYNNTDFFSPEMDHALAPEELAPYLERVNLLLRKKGRSELDASDLHSQVNQLKAMIDLCHLYGLAVILDMVYNHAGGPFDDQSLRFFDRPWNREWWDPDSYFIGGEGWAGGRIFDYGRDEVRNFLIQNAMMLLGEFHVDGFRYDEVSVIHNNNGSRFCRDLTDSLRYARPGAIQIAEYWNWDRAKAVEPAPDGLGFDAALHDGLRGAIRAAIGAAARGRSAYVDLDAIRDALRRPAGFSASWKAVNHIENHDLVDGDRADPGDTQPRIPALANWTGRRDWLARSRSRVATGLLLTAPGIPMLFMGQEFLEDKPWHNDPARTDLFLYWNGVDEDGPMRDFLRFTRELCWLRRRHQALRGEGLEPYFSHNHERVLAFQRWVEGAGRDVIVVASLSETTRSGYPLPFPQDGHWHEVFNSDAYDSLPAAGGYNPNVAGNPGGVTADGPPLYGCPSSGSLVLPANALLV
ncbi:MAG: alpha amylase C-terminal domain-containing protein, partial [Geminicoccaceae bacterium]